MDCPSLREGARRAETGDNHHRCACRCCSSTGCRSENGQADAGDHPEQTDRSPTRTSDVAAFETAGASDGRRSPDRELKTAKDADGYRGRRSGELNLLTAARGFCHINSQPSRHHDLTDRTIVRIVWRLRRPVRAIMSIGRGLRVTAFPGQVVAAMSDLGSRRTRMSMVAAAGVTILGTGGCMSR